MAKFNYDHIARAYSRQDLETLQERCQDAANDLWTLANLDLCRSTGTIAQHLNEISDILEEIAKAAWAANQLKDGRTLVVGEIGGVHLYATE